MTTREWPHRCSAAMVARAFGVTAQAVGRWECPKDRDNIYDLPEVIKWKVARECLKATEGLVTTKSSGGGYDPEQIRKWAAEASLKELELGEALQTFVRKADVEAQVARAIVTFKQTIEGWPVTLAPRLAHREPAQIRDELTRATHDALAQFSRDMQKVGEAMEEEIETEAA